MSAQIDVLAVLRSQLTWIGPCRPDGDEIDCERWDRIESAIAATAELIEALEIARKQMAHRGCGRVRPTSEWKEHGSMSFDNCNCDIRKVDAALARVKGA